MEKPNTTRDRDGVSPDLASESAIFYDVLDDSEIGMFILDRDFTVAWANETIGDYFGFDVTDSIGMDKRSLIQDSFQDIFERGDEFVRRVLATYDDNSHTERFECHVLGDERRDERYLEHRSKPITEGVYAGGRVELYYDITSQKEREVRLESYESVVEVARDPICVLNLDFEFEIVNEAFVDFINLERDTLIGNHISVVVDEGIVSRETLAQGGEALERLLEDGEERSQLVVTEPSDDGEIIFDSSFSLITHDGEPIGIVSVGRDITERAHREQMLATQRNELETLDRVNSIIRGVNQKLVKATTIDEIAQAVCDELASSDLYQAAVLMEQDESEAEPIPRGIAGIEEEILQPVFASEEVFRRETPAWRAFHTGELEFVPNIFDVPKLPDEIKTVAKERNFRSLVITPVPVGSTMFGVLIVQAGRSDAFSDHEQAVFEELGEIIGDAIDAAEQRRLLHADSVLELEFRTTDNRTIVGKVSEALECTFRLEEIIPTSKGSVVEYISVEGIPAEAVLERAAADFTGTSARIIESNADGGLFELNLEDGSLAKALLEQGARLRDGVAIDGVVQLTVEVAPDVNVRSFTEQLQRDFPELELMRKTTVERPVQSVREFRQSIDDSLTDQQRIALRTAYLAGYYDWPRDSTAEEVASVLDVSPPTFHQHLRKAQQKVFSHLYES
ncbi:bacterio-opsin activator domain-containing protein [Haladaptatus sp. NG-SE-30]